MIDVHRQEWEAYVARERAALEPMLAQLGYALDADQPHIQGERYLTQAITTASGRKLILLGTRAADGKRAVIKATSDAAGMQELEHERLCRRVLHEIDFAYELFTSPEELAFGKFGERLISIQAYVEQDSTFLARPLKDQFAYALGAFKAQESAHAATYEHQRVIAKTFGSMDAAAYLAAFDEFERNILARRPDDARLKALLTDAREFLSSERETIERYSGFLTHTDFVPHNIRIKDGQIYLLDYSSLRFGNKYEGWARFLNFMALYNHALEAALITYVRDNRTPEESLSLKLMRVYRLAEIIWYYVRNLERSAGDIALLNEARIEFWTSVLEAVLGDKPIAPEIREAYIRTRDSLRTEDEKRRQQGLH